MSPKLVPRLKFWLGGLAFLLTMIPAPVAAAGPGGDGHRPAAARALAAVRPTHTDADVRNLPRTQLTPPGAHARDGREPGARAAGPSGPVADPIARGGAGAAPMPGTAANFAGLDQFGWGAGWPPDTNGDVGPTVYIQTVNTSVGIWDKTTGLPLTAFFFNDLWASQLTPSGTPCDTMNQGDPIVLYDAYRDRWMVMDFAWDSTFGTTGPFFLCFAESATPDPVAGGWNFYAFQSPDPTPGLSQLPDYPKLGVAPGAYFMSTNQFTMPAGTYAGARVWAFDAAAMAAGAPASAYYGDLGTAYFSLLPGNSRGDSLAGPEPFASIDFPNSSLVHLWQMTATFGPGGGATLTGPTDITVAPYVHPARTAIPQPGTAQRLDTLGDRLMAQAQLRTVGGVESLWLSHTVASGTTTGVRWYQLTGTRTGTPALAQQGTYDPGDGAFRWMPSLAVDKQGNAAVGFSASSPTLFPAIRYAGRLASDPSGTLGQTETSLIEGAGSQTTFSRWGDYSAMTVDVDGCTFWFTTEYYAATGTNWQTRIGSFKFPTCV